MPTNSVDIGLYIEYGKIAGFVVSDYIGKKSLFGNPYFNPTQSQSIRWATKALESAYLRDNGSAAAQSIAQYQYSLYSGFIGAIKKIIGNAQGIIVTPVASTGNTFLVQERYYPQFEVGDDDAPMEEGDTVLIINDEDIAPQTDDAKVDIHVDGIQEGQALIDQTSFNAVYSTGQYVITLTSPVRNGNVFIIKYPVKTNLTYQTSSAFDGVFTAQLINVQTKTLINTVGNIFIVAINTVNVVKFTLFCISTANDYFIMEWSGTVKNTAGTIAIIGASTAILQNDYGYDINGDPLLVVVISADQTNHGVAVTITGIAGKTINCRAIFTNTTNAITNLA